MIILEVMRGTWNHLSLSDRATSERLHSVVAMDSALIPIDG
jgi:hypothetical protein